MESLSIHPRVTFPDGVKKNTAMPPKDSNKGKLGFAKRRLNERRLDHSATIKSLPSNVNPASYRTPGSMKGKFR
jgi:hypothetical protein